MAYSDFTLAILEERLGLTYEETTGAFEEATPIAVSEVLRQTLDRGLPVVLGRNKEKARSEMLISPILLELREYRARQVSIFSGAEFNVDRKNGLAGFCDFLIARSPFQTDIVAPVVAIVEAKHEDLNDGIAQCFAEMYAARLFNEKRGKPIETVYGATTSGTAWRFLRLSGTLAQADLTEYHISQVEKILGILASMLRE